MGEAMFAQSLVEYGLLASVVTAAQGAVYAVRDWVARSPEEAWALAGVLALATILWARSERR
jgi:hypothetical protein